MAHVSSNPLRHSDLYNRIEDWITESDAAQNSYEAQDARSSLLHPPSYYLQPVSYAFDKDRYDEIMKRNAELENMPTRFAERQPGWLGWENYYAQRGGVTMCYPSVQQRQARVGQMASLEPTESQQPVASSTVNDMETSSNTEKRGRNGYERQPRHRTKKDRYEYKVQNKKSSERPRSKKRTNNDSFHAPNVPCDRLTLNQRRPSGIFRRGKASSPVRTRSRDPSLDFFGFDTILNIETKASAGSGFSESDFLHRSNTNQATLNGPTYGHFEEECGSITGGTMYKSVVSDTASPVALYRSQELPKADDIATEPKAMTAISEPATDSYVSALVNPPSRNSEVHCEKEPGSQLTSRNIVDNTSVDEGQRCSTRLDGVSQKCKHPCDAMRLDELADRSVDENKAVDQGIKERGLDKKVVAAPVHGNTISQFALPNASKCWQPTLEPGSTSVADTEEFDYEGAMGATLRKTITPDYDRSSRFLNNGSRDKSSLMSVVDNRGENVQGHQSQIRQMIEEPDYESLDFAGVPEANDCCSEMASLIDMEEWEIASVIVDMDTVLDTQVLSMPTSSAAICNKTQEIQERLEATQLGRNIQGKQPHHICEAMLEESLIALSSPDNMRETSSAAKGSQVRNECQRSEHDRLVASEATNIFRPGPWLESLSRRRRGAIGTLNGRLDATDGLGTFWQQRMGY
ncbi:hypothetical protein AnigIFM50267_001336 [Aspergillus niger]|nr:hypothetical protein AnigIFM50267_001336 [Aspergillus niger]